MSGGRETYTPTSAAWRARRYLLLPIIPIFTLLGLLVVGLTLSLLPDGIAVVGLLVVWAVSLYHAARRSRPAWVVAIAIVWPVLVAYWIYVGLRLDRP